MPAPATDTRQALLDATADHLAERGLDGLSLREIARRAGVSHGAPLRHFPTLAALLSAVAAEGFRGLQAAVTRAVDEAGPNADGMTRLRAASRGYTGFAASNPGSFQLMFRPDRVDTDDAEYAACGLASFFQLEELVRGAQAEGFHPDVPTARLAGVVWSGVHGLAELWLHGALPAVTGADDLADMTDLLAAVTLADDRVDAAARPPTPTHTHPTTSLEEAS